MSRRAPVLAVGVFATLVGIASADETPPLLQPDESSPREDDSPRAADNPSLEAPAPTTTRGYVFEAAVRSGYTTPPIRGGVNPFGAGFGARLGFNISHVYVGATVLDYLGGSDVGATDQAVLYGMELGYSLRVGPHFTLRPELGVGDAVLSHTEPVSAAVDVVTSASGSSSGASSVTTQVKNIYLESGLTAMLASGAFFAAVRGSALVLPGIVYGPAPAEETTWVSYSVELQLGFRL